jgi:4-amino-4-deoxy-L-arabinose transferase-like glycosyltransferase
MTRAEGQIGLPEWAWLGIGYALFAFASLSLIEIWAVTPDMLMAALVFLAAHLVVRILCGSNSYWMYLLLGIVLGLGYLAKAIMLPISLVFLAASAFATVPLRKEPLAPFLD